MSDRNLGRAASGAVSEEQCLPCPTGTFSDSEGATQCDGCPSGSYVTLLSRNEDGFGVGSGGETCVDCPAGRESTVDDSIECASCLAGSSSTVGEPCAVCQPGTYAQAAGAALPDHGPPAFFAPWLYSDNVTLRGGHLGGV